MTDTAGSGAGRERAGPDRLALQKSASEQKRLLPWQFCERHARLPILTVPEHAWGLGWFVGGHELPKFPVSDGSPSWYTVGNWLMAAGGIHDVHFDLHHYDGTTDYCPPPYTADEEEQMAGFVQDLARFSFTWHAYEATLHATHTRAQIDKHGGEVALGTSTLLSAEQTGVRLEHTDCTLKNLSVVLGRLKGRTYEKACARLAAADEPRLSNGLAAVAHFRNGFAHGGLFFPHPQATFTAVADRSVVILSTRVVLLCLQAIMIELLSEWDVLVTVYDEELEEQEVEARTLLARLQLTRHWI